MKDNQLKIEYQMNVDDYMNLLISKLIDQIKTSSLWIYFLLEIDFLKKN